MRDTVNVASQLEPALRQLLVGEPPVAVRFWDGSRIGPDTDAALVVRSPRAIRRLLYAPNELGLGRAYVAGELDCEGSIFDVLALRDALEDRDGDADMNFGRAGWLSLARAARSLGMLGKPLPAPPEEARARGRLHSKERDAVVVRHHYDVSNDFYRLVLGDSMTYSCAYFASGEVELGEAQRAKYELVSRKLGLQPGMRLLDVGCGWGGMVMHAAQEHGVRAVGVTLAREQQELAAKRVAEAGLSDRIEIRLQDYRDVDDGPYDAISSIGMFEHVGLARLHEYFQKLRELLPPQGRLLNHAISRPSGQPAFDRRSFVQRYVFPDGELHEVGTVVSALQEDGLEVRDVQSLREHYARTLRAWVANLEAGWDAAVGLVGEARARIWRLYMAASALAFEAGRISVHQVLAVKPDRHGASGMPPTRSGWDA